MKINLKKVRLMQHDVFEAKPFEAGAPLYFGAEVSFEPGSVNDKIVRAALKQTAAEKKEWATNHAKLLAAALAKNSRKEVCLWDGDGVEYTGYAGQVILTTKRKVEKGRPLVIDRDKSPLAEADGRIYRGCYVNISAEVWAQDNKFGKTLRCELLGVQFAADGDAFSAGSIADESDFDDLSDSGDGEELA